MSNDRPVATNIFWKDSYLAYIPLLGAAVAVAFDVGCFYAIGINFFPLFSLSEHIVFALPAFPIALILLFLSTFAFISKSTPPRTPPRTFGSLRRLHQIAVIFIILALFSIAIAALVPIFRRSPEMIFILIEIGIIGFVVVVIDSPYKTPIIAALVTATILTISLIFGIYVGAAYLNKADAPDSVLPSTFSIIQFNDGATLRGRLIRSGERGVLLYDPEADQVRFMLWDKMESIKAAPPKLTPKGK